MTEGDINNLYQNALSFFESGNFEEAKNGFQKVLENDPQNLDCHIKLSTIFFKQGMLDAALQFAVNAYNIKPHDYQTFTNLIDILEALNIVDSIVQVYWIYLNEHPDDLNVLKRFAITAYKLLDSMIKERERLGKERMELDKFLSALFELLEKHQKVRISRQYVNPAVGDHLTCWELLLRKKQLYPEEAQTIDVVLTRETHPNEQLAKMYKRYLPVYESDAAFELIDSLPTFSKSKYYRRLSHSGDDFREFVEGKVTLQFLPEEEQLGQRLLREMGVPEGAWFATHLTRDSAFKGYKEVTPSDYRNADIKNCHKAFDFIVQQGGYVFRMGSKVAGPLEYKHPQVIDYATKHRSDFMDIYLFAKCRFFFGSGAGITDVTMLFNLPRLYLNLLPVGFIIQGFGLFLPKIARKSDTGELANYRELLEMGKDKNWYPQYDGIKMAELGYIFEENSEDEILATLEEFYARLNGTWIEKPEDRERLERFYDLWPKDHWCRSPYMRHQIIGTEFLRNHSDYFFGK